MLTVSELIVYPIKSLGGMALQSATLTDRGLEHDRRWMLVDEHNHFITQRDVAAMALLQVNLLPNGLEIRHKTNSATFTIPFLLTSTETTMVQVWSSRCRAQWVSCEADGFFSEMLAKKCRLVYMAQSTKRPVDGRYAFKKELTSFADDFPLLMIGQASLDDLNSRLAAPMLMDRFRPNIVFTGGAAFAEDDLSHFTINDISFFGVKRCARCPIVTINQQTAKAAKEPLKTLATYRFTNNKVYFGQNLLFEGSGTIHVGDRLLAKP